MILGPQLLLKLVKEHKLVENLAERELTNPEGAGFDLRLGAVYKIFGTGFLGVTERQTPDSELVAKYVDPAVRHPSGLSSAMQNEGARLPDKGGKRSASRISKNKTDSGQALRQAQDVARMTIPNVIIFKPGDFYLVQTIESFNMPENLTANFKPRTTTFRSGLFLRTGNVAPGYKGQVSFGMTNEGPCEVTIEMGARFVHVQFEEVKGGGSMYRGQWQGGRVSAKEREKQV